MPITDELKNVDKLEAAGFSTKQAKAIAEVLEEGIQRGFERFAEVLDRRFGEMDHKLTDMELRLRADIHQLRAELMKEQRDLMLKFTAIVSLVAAVIGTVLRYLGH